MNKKKLIILLIIVFSFLMSHLLAIASEEDETEIFRIVNEIVGGFANADGNRIAKVMTTKNDIIFVSPDFGKKEGGMVIFLLRWLLPFIDKGQITLMNVVCIIRGEEASVSGNYHWVTGEDMRGNVFVVRLRKEKREWKAWALDFDGGKEIQPFAPGIQKVIQITLTAYAKEDIPLLGEVISDDISFSSLEGAFSQGKEDTFAVLREEFARNDDIQLTFNSENLVVYLSDKENLANVSVPFVYQCANEPQKKAFVHLTLREVGDWRVSRLDFESISCPPAHPWDVNGDNEVNIYDLVLVGRHFGQTTYEGDVNRDGQVDISDLVLVGSHFGESYE